MEEQQNTDTSPMDLPFVNPEQFPCLECGKTFKSAPALRMHHVRAHGKGWDTSSNFGRGGSKGKFKNEAERLAHRRQYQKRLRARYYREGKNSRGEQMPPGWKPRGKYEGATGAKWTEERRARFIKTMRQKARRKAMADEGKLLPGRRIRYVYPEPGTADPGVDKSGVSKLAQPNPARPKICPNCGEELWKWRKEQ